MPSIMGCPSLISSEVCISSVIATGYNPPSYSLVSYAHFVLFIIFPDVVLSLRGLRGHGVQVVVSWVQSIST